MKIENLCRASGALTRREKEIQACLLFEQPRGVCVTRRALVHMKGAVMMTRHPHVTRCHLQHLPKVERELETSNDEIGAGSTWHRPPLLLRHVAKLGDPQLEVGLDRLGDISGGAAGFADLQGDWH